MDLARTHSLKPSLAWQGAEQGTQQGTPEPEGPSQPKARNGQTYRLEVRAIYPKSKGVPDDIAAEVVMTAQQYGLEVVSCPAFRGRGSDIVVVSLAFVAPDDHAALTLCGALPVEIRWASAEADRLRTGTGRSWRHLR